MAKTPATKKTADKAPAKKADKAEKAAAPKTGGIHKPVTPSKELAEIVGAEALPRSEMVSKVWDYIRKHDLQNPENRREILADDKLKKIFGKDKATMFEMNKHLSAHVK